jgi:EpsI family protein
MGSDLSVSDKERQTLGEETEFARKSYKNGRGDEIHVSIVLGGRDMNTSIHRPERCLPAQGWTVNNKSTVKIRLPERGVLETTRLYNVRNVPGPDEKPIPVYSLNYYWFTGYTDTTASHLDRTLIDMRDRVVTGQNQRWAYITVAGTITKGLTRFGRSEKEVDALIQELIKRLTPKIHLASVKYS